MRTTIFKLLILFNLILADTNGQGIIPTNCDSIILTKQEYEKCKADTAWTNDIIIKTNYITSFKTELLPKYRVIRKGLALPASLQNLLRQFKTTYDSVLTKKLSTFQDEMDKNQKYVQPKAYLSSLLSLQVFKFYPDIFAILLNDIHLMLSPITSREELGAYKLQFDLIIKSIPVELYSQLVKITNDIETDKSNLMKHGFAQMFQGPMEEDYRSQYNIVNFLLWDE